MANELEKKKVTLVKPSEEDRNNNDEDGDGAMEKTTKMARMGA